MSRGEPGWGVFQAQARRVFLRNSAAEEAAYRRLRQLGARPIQRGEPRGAADLEMMPERLPRAVRDLLDPWWNPAVEAQPVDRAHRIGQQRAVFAYRLIAKDTVEEKVLALQQTKRELADAILGPDNSLVRDLRREDLELLLS